MPNNANARREKDKKKKDKNKKTDPPPLHKEDKASVDSSSLSLAAKDKASVDSSSSLSLAGIHEVPEIERLERNVLGAKHSWSLSLEERVEVKEQVRRGNPGASEEEIKILYRARLLDDALKAQAKKRQSKKDSPLLSLSSEELQEQALSCALDEMEKAIQENANAVHEKDASWSWAMSALLVDHARATTADDRVAMRRKIREEM
jgi:hypothetical protein